MTISKMGQTVITPTSPLFNLCSAALALVLGCQASVQAEATVSSADEEVEVHDFDKPLDAPPVKVATDTAEFSLEQYALLGARHDLSYAGPAEPSCQCLAVSLQEHANHPSFAWEVSAPRIEPATQWVIALSSENIECSRAPQGALGASYQGYEVRGNNVIVMVEPLVEGRPLTHGAVIPKPLAGGDVFIQASGAVYGKPLAGRSKHCKVQSTSGNSELTASR